MDCPICLTMNHLNIAENDICGAHNLLTDFSSGIYLVCNHTHFLYNLWPRPIHQQIAHIYIKDHFVAWSCFFVSEFLEKFNNFSWKRNIRWDRFNANQFDLVRIMRHCIVQHALCLWGWDHSRQRKWERREVTPPWIWVLCTESISEVTKRISYRSYRVQISRALYV